MFDALTPAPADPILGLTEAFRADPNPRKINLGVGVYKDNEGQTPLLQCVRLAQQRITQQSRDKNYLPIAGSAQYAADVQGLIFGGDHAILTHDLARTAHTPGGTGALRVAGELLARVAPKATVWLSEPTWANHPQIFAAAGVPTKTYPYLDRGQNRLAFERTLEAIEAIPPGDVLLLHGCCHNPTGVDPTDEQWRAIGQIVNRRGLLPLVDLAYQGFGQGLDEDVRGLRHLWQQGTEMIVCSSYSKNFSLYNERVGAMTLVAGTSDSAEAAFSHAKRCIRANYSNPPAHGAALVHTILAQPELKAMWLEELTQMRQRIAGNRRRLVESLKQQGVNDIDFIAQQQGMFTLLNLNAEQIKTLREQHAIYVVGSGRINVAGLSSEQIPLLARALADVWVNAGSSAGA